jgi:hypothetical protein
MAKLILLSNIMMGMYFPIRTARDPNPRRGLRRAVQYVALYNIFYVFAALVIYPHLK